MKETTALLQDCGTMGVYVLLSAMFYLINMYYS